MFGKMNPETVDNQKRPTSAVSKGGKSDWIKRVIYFIPIYVLTIVVFVFYLNVGRNSKTIPSAPINEPVPDFVLPPLSANAQLPGFSSKDLVGEVTVVNFFASWCFPCLKEHPYITEISRSGLAKVYGHNYRDRPDKAQNWLRKYGNPYLAVGADPSGRVALDWGVSDIPVTIVIDKTGRIRFKRVGFVTSKILNQTIFPLIKQLRSER